jgi:hypothetical protein
MAVPHHHQSMEALVPVERIDEVEQAGRSNPLRSGVTPRQDRLRMLRRAASHGEPRRDANRPQPVPRFAAQMASTTRDLGDVEELG